MFITSYKPSKRVIAVAFGCFMACALAMLGYQVRLSRLMPEPATEDSHLKSIKMLHERSVLDAQAVDHDSDEVQTLALSVVVDAELPSTSFQAPACVSVIQLNLSPHAGYRRPPPAC